MKIILVKIMQCVQQILPSYLTVSVKICLSISANVNPILDSLDTNAKRTIKRRSLRTFVPEKLEAAKVSKGLTHFMWEFKGAPLITTFS